MNESTLAQKRFLKRFRESLTENKILQIASAIIEEAKTVIEETKAVIEEIKIEKILDS